MTLGKRIAQHRKALGLSQEALGERLGVSRQAVSKWETNAAAPDMENLLALCREFGVSLAELSGTPEAPERRPRPLRHFLPVLWREPQRWACFFFWEAALPRENLHPRRQRRFPSHYLRLPQILPWFGPTETARRSFWNWAHRKRPSPLGPAWN